MSLPKKKKLSSLNFGKDIVIKLEDFEEGEYYALTLSAEKQYRGFDSTQRMIKVYKYLQKYMSGYPYIKYNLWPEISTGMANIHFHGWMCIEHHKDIFRLYMEFIPKTVELFSIALKPQGEGGGWNSYCKKQSKVMKQVCNNIDLAYPLTEKIMEDCITEYKNESKLFKHLIEIGV